MRYNYYVEWFNPETKEPVYLGDFFRYKEARETIEDWCEECEHPNAKKPENYTIRRLTE